MNLKLNQDLRTPKGKLLKGAIVSVESDKNGIPIDLFWRNRVKDSAIDNCVEVLEEKKSQPKSKK